MMGGPPGMGAPGMGAPAMGGAPGMGAPPGMMGAAPPGPPGMMGGAPGMMGGAPGMMGGGGGGDVNTTLPLVLGILSTLCCGMFIGFGLGIAAIVLAVQAGNAKKSGDMVTAAAKAKTATILGGVGLGLGIVLDIIGNIVARM